MSDSPISNLASFVEAFTTELAQEDVAVLIGGAALQQHGAPPRVVFVPQGDTFAQPIRVGGTPRALYTRSIGFGIHVWGIDFPTTEQLLVDVVVAMRRLAGGPSLTLGNAVWIGQDGELVTHGDAVELQGCALQIPVFDRTPTTAEIQSTEVECDPEED